MQIPTGKPVGIYRLLMVFPHAVFLSQDPVENLAGRRFRHLFVLDEGNVFRYLEAGNCAFAEIGDHVGLHYTTVSRII